MNKTLRLDIAASVDEAKFAKQLADHIERQFDSHLRSAFSDGSYGRPAGVAYNTVRSIAERQLADKLVECEAQIAALIEQHWPTLLREATLRALHHKANSIAFSRAKAKLPLDVGGPNGVR